MVLGFDVRFKAAAMLLESLPWILCPRTFERRTPLRVTCFVAGLRLSSITLLFLTHQFFNRAFPAFDHESASSNESLIHYFQRGSIVTIRQGLHMILAAEQLSTPRMRSAWIVV